MIEYYNAYRTTRKLHICGACKKQIPVGTKCYWYKAVAFKESDIGRDEWIESYICPECDAKAQEDE